MIYSPSFFLQLLFLCPVHNAFLPTLRQPAGKSQHSSFSTKKCIPHVPRRKYYFIEVSRLQNDFTIHSSKMAWLTTKLLHSKKAIFVTPCTFFHRFQVFTIYVAIYRESVCPTIHNTWRHIYVPSIKVVQLSGDDHFLNSGHN